MNQAFYYSCFRSLVVLSLTLTGLGGLLGGCQPKPEPEPVAVNIPRKISALGRIEPETKIRKVAVSSSLSGDRIDDILVEENQVVEKGYPLAILNSYGTLKAALDEANKLVAVAQGRLDQVKAGAKQGEIRAQQFKIESLQRQLAQEKLIQEQTVGSARTAMEEAKIEAARYEKLSREGAVWELQRDRSRARAETTEFDLKQAIAVKAQKLSTLESDIESAKQTLNQIAEVRPVDVNAAETELRKAIAARDRAQQEFDFATVRAPQNGEILKIIARPGDKVGDEGILEMADLTKMIVTAEIYQTDLPKVFLGQKATITADGFEAKITGVVYQINRQVQKQTIFTGEPGENLDLRVFEVKLRLDPKDIGKVKYASNLQVNVVFEPKPEEKSPTPEEKL
jgi:HlyD family secretion protein